MTFKTFFFFCLLLANNYLGISQTGKVFPEIIGENLNDLTIKFPEELKGKYSIIGLAYSRKAEDDLKTWLNPAYSKFISGNRAIDFDVNVYFLPVFTGANQALTSSARKKVQSETDKEIHPHVVFFKGNVKIFKNELGLENKDIPYFYVLNQEGLIVFSTSGRYTEKKMDEIENILN